MGLIDNPTYAMLERALAFRDARQSVISSNVANANTPGYRSFDLVMGEQMGEPTPLSMQRTSAAHAAGDAGAGLGARTVRSDAPARLDGNNVSLDAELVRMMENRVMYNVAFELLDKWGGLTPLARDVR